MKSFLIFLAIAILSYVTGLLHPWWTIAIVAFVVVLIIPLKPLGAFSIGFLAIFVLWSSLAAYRGLMNDHILDDRISQLFIQQSAPVVMVLITGFVGGLVAGCAALTASLLRTKKKTRTTGYN